mmetsp:Transcript_6388/g.24702  ORF Transcript_6388/g.24702 Transcript_6388/m.24702 type:complete len:307 (-) Transcript_6388:1980-2900(-)
MVRQREDSRRAVGVLKVRQRPPRGVPRGDPRLLVTVAGHLRHVRRRVPGSPRPPGRERHRDTSGLSRAVAQVGLDPSHQHADRAVLREHRAELGAHRLLLNLGRVLRERRRRGQYSEHGHEGSALARLLRGHEAHERAAPPVRVVAREHPQGHGSVEELVEEGKSVRGVERERAAVDPFADFLQRGDTRHLLLLVLRKRVFEPAEGTERSFARDALLERAPVLHGVVRALLGRVGIREGARGFGTLDSGGGGDGSVGSQIEVAPPVGHERRTSHHLRVARVQELLLLPRGQPARRRDVPPRPHVRA